jgi:hypothetical protein
MPIIPVISVSGFVAQRTAPAVSVHSASSASTVCPVLNCSARSASMLVAA